MKFANVFSSFSILALLGLLVSCNTTNTDADLSYQDTVGVDTALTLASDSLFDLSYGPDERNLLDVYLPSGRTAATPVVVFIHGGQWEDLDKSYFRRQARLFMSHGFAAVCISYRYMSDSLNVHHPAEMHDIGKALAFAVSQSDAWQVSSDQLGIIGHSAGAHLTALYSYAWDQTNQVDAIYVISTPADLSDSVVLANPLNLRVMQQYCGAPLIGNELLWQSCSPLYQVKTTVPRTYVVAGDQDQYIDYHQSLRLNDSLNSYGIDHESNLFPGQDHFLAEVENPANVYADSIWQNAIDWMMPLKAR